MKIFKSPYVVVTLLLLIVISFLSVYSTFQIDKEAEYTLEKADEFQWVIELGEYDEISVLTDKPLRYLVKNKNGEYGITDELGKEILPCEYGEISSVNGSEILLVKGDEDYYMNDSGEVLLEGEFSDATCYYGDYAAVTEKGMRKIIDKEGNTVLNEEQVKSLAGKRTDMKEHYWYSDEIEASNLKPVKEDVFTFVNGDHVGLINARTKEIIIEANKYTIYKGYSEGMYIFGVAHDYEIPEPNKEVAYTGWEQFFYVDEDGNEMFKDIYISAAGDFSEGLAIIQKAEINDTSPEEDDERLSTIEMGIIDKNGNYNKLNNELVFEEINKFSEGYVFIPGDYSNIIIDKDQKQVGKIEIDSYMSNYGYYNEGLMPYGVITDRKYNNKIGFYEKSRYGYIDYEGEYVIEPVFDFADIIHNNQAVIALANEYGVIKVSDDNEEED